MIGAGFEVEGIESGASRSKRGQSGKDVLEDLGDAL